MKVKKILTISLLFFSVMFWEGLPHLSVQNATAQTKKEELPWDKLYEKEPPRKEEIGGSRGSVELCTIAPESLSGEAIRIWSDRPLFIWQGNSSKIEVRKRSTTQVLWSQEITTNDNSILYSGPPLQPGKSYDWLLFEEGSNMPTFQVSFQMLPAEERDRISADLNSIEIRLQQEGAAAEKIAYAKATYFASRQMWPDVFKSAYEVKNPSEALMKFIQNIPQQFCRSLPPSENQPKN